jgi:hypothetical protein
MAETADLKSLARLIIGRDTSRDSERDSLSRPPETISVSARQWGCRPPVQPGVVEGARPDVPEQYRAALSALQEGCTAYVDVLDWQMALADADGFLATWGEQASALGWTVSDLFGLAPIPQGPTPNWRRLSRYDLAGLVWLLRGRPVIALSAKTAAIQCSGFGVTTYRRARDTMQCAPIF